MEGGGRGRKRGKFMSCNHNQGHRSRGCCLLVPGSIKGLYRGNGDRVDHTGIWGGWECGCRQRTSLRFLVLVIPI